MKEIETILVENNEVTITRRVKDFKTYHPSETRTYQPTEASKKRFFKVLNREINKQHGPQVNIQPGWVEVEW